MFLWFVIEIVVQPRRITPTRLWSIALRGRITACFFITSPAQRSSGV